MKKIKTFILEHKRQVLILSAVIFLVGAISLIVSPRNFPIGKIISIKEGQGISSVGKMLENENIIRSSFVFNIVNIINNSHVIEGDYLFPKKINLFEVISKINKGSYEIPTVKITFYEGMNVKEMAEILEKNLLNFDANRFIEIAAPKEGYLFPDTYEFRRNVTPEKVVEILNENFNNQIKKNEDKLSESKYTLEEIVIMASIVEKEADLKNRQEVANILWGRYEIGMALQVDAPFVYYINKNSFELTIENLRDDHPYNTYTRTGLTQTPIGNPGIDTILASAFPKPTPYVYFLTGLDGNFYFAETFEQHKRNKELYLN
jgi:UPF0755 protein